MDVKDLVGLSKPLTRLIEVISQGLGAVSGPYLIRKNADARAHEIRVISAALSEVAKEHCLPVVYDEGRIEVWQRPDDHTLILERKEVNERTSLRIDYQERKRQSNIESITSSAAIELGNAESIPDQKPDEDWVVRFFTSAQEVSSEQMQDLWGRILAGEIKRPGTYSLRTLDFVRNLTKSDAELLTTIGRLSIDRPGIAFVAAQDKEWLLSKRNVSVGHHFALGELDVMYQTELAIQTFRDPETTEEVFFQNDMLLVVKRGDLLGKVDLPIWKFTTIGAELLPLVPSHSDDEYLEKLGQFFAQQKCIASIAKIVERLGNGEVRYQILRQVVATANAT